MESILMTGFLASANLLFRMGDAGGSKRLRHAPSLTEPDTDRHWRKTYDLRPFGKTEGFAIMGESMIVPFVPSLFLVRCPTAIAWLIIPVVVDPVDVVVTRGLGAHIGEEFIERIHPLFADLDSPSPVQMVADVIPVGASGSDAEPCPIFRGMMEPPSPELHPCPLEMTTMASPRSVRSQVATTDLGYRSARTFAPPIGKRLPLSGVSKHDPFLKLPVGEVDKPRISRNWMEFHGRCPPLQLYRNPVNQSRLFLESYINPTVFSIWRNP